MCRETKKGCSGKNKPSESKLPRPITRLYSLCTRVGTAQTGPWSLWSAMKTHIEVVMSASAQPVRGTADPQSFDMLRTHIAFTDRRGKIKRLSDLLGKRFGKVCGGGWTTFTPGGT